MRDLALGALALALTAAPLFLAPAPACAGPYVDAAVPSSVPVAWATVVESLVRGPRDLNADPNLVTFGSAPDALGAADGSVVSLGDGGSITLSFGGPILNGAGDDFAVYENGFTFGALVFAELAYVEVSSNGSDFARFASDSLTVNPNDPNDFGGFGLIDPTEVDGLAGKFPAMAGTAFDLADLSTHPLVLSGDVDLTSILLLRLVDVVGDGSSLDTSGDPIFDPYPSAFASGGFDLDAVGLLPEPGGGLLALLGAFAALVCRRAS